MKTHWTNKGGHFMCRYALEPNAKHTLRESKVTCAYCLRDLKGPTYKKPAKAHRSM